jgi:hypothetical protein
MANSLQVTLDTSRKTLQVDASTVLNPGLEPQTISWHLEGNAAGGTFLYFVWVQEPPAGIFGPFTSIRGSGWATLANLHVGDTSAGTWPYRLAVEIKGVTYWTPPPKAEATESGGTPNIKNN